MDERLFSRGLGDGFGVRPAVTAIADVGYSLALLSLS
jgi:hypothetical protein